MSDRRVRIGVIGCGLMGRLHAETLRLLPGAELGAACDVRLKAAEALVTDLGFPDAYVTADPARLFADPDLDGVLVCTHHNSHHALAMGALQAGKHLFIEKPMAGDLAECREIAGAAQATGRQVVVGFFSRFAPAVQQVKEVALRPIASVGQMSSARWPDDFWAQDRHLGGGNVFSQGCHLLDLLCYLQEDEPVAVTAQGGTMTHRQGPIDTVVATIRFAQGAVASLFIADAGLSPHTGKAMIQLFAIERTVAIHHLFGGERGQAVWWPPRTDPDITPSGPLEWDPTGHRSLLRNFVAGIGESLPAGTPTAADGVRAVALIDALFAAVRDRDQEVLVEP